VIELVRVYEEIHYFFGAEIINNFFQFYVKDNQVFLLNGG
jgi:hypothetical protein